MGEEPYTLEFGGEPRLIQAAQVLGAIVTKDHFFTKQNVREFSKRNLVQVVTKAGGWTVMVRADVLADWAVMYVPDNPRKEAQIVSRPT